MSLPHARSVTLRPLVRRIYARPIALPQQRIHVRDDGWLLRGPVIELSDADIISGGWWNRDIHREYHFAHTRRGELLWVFYDRQRRRWFLHGQVQ